MLLQLPREAGCIAVLQQLGTGTVCANSKDAFSRGYGARVCKVHMQGRAAGRWLSSCGSLHGVAAWSNALISPWNRLGMGLFCR